MILARFNANGTLDTTYGTNGFVSRALRGTPTTSPGASGATALALDAAGNVLATGFGGSQSMFVARFSPTGAMTSSVVCFAPHLIDYTAHAIAPRPDGSVVIAGQARDRWHGTPYPFYGARAVVQVTGGSARATAAARGAPRRSTRATIGSSGVTIDGLTLDGVVLNASLAGRQYHGVAVRRDGSYVTAAVNGAISSFTAGERGRHRLRQRRHDDDRRRPRCTPCACSPTAASSPAARAPARRTSGACWSPSSARRAHPRPASARRASSACSPAPATTRARR